METLLDTLTDVDTLEVADVDTLELNDVDVETLVPELEYVAKLLDRLIVQERVLEEVVDKLKLDEVDVDVLTLTLLELDTVDEGVTTVVATQGLSHSSV